MGHKYRKRGLTTRSKPPEVVFAASVSPYQSTQDATVVALAMAVLKNMGDPEKARRLHGVPKALESKSAELPTAATVPATIFSGLIK